MIGWMYRLKRAEIYGLWGERTAIIPFHPDVNFLIGANGSGKTTIVNIIGAALSATRLQLMRLPFESVNIAMTRDSDAAEAEIRVARQRTETGASFEVTILEGAQPKRSYTLSKPRFTIGSNVAGRGADSPQQQIARMINMQWLSVHRAPVQTGDKQKSYESTVDIKLAQVREDFAKYMTLLGQRSHVRLWKFMDTVLLSVIDQPTFNSVASFVEDLNIESEETTVGEMFETIWLSKEQYASKLTSFMRMLEAAVEKQKQSQPLTDDEIGAFFAMRRLRMLEQEWRQTMQDQKEIKKPIDDFLDAMNGLLTRKKLDVNEDSELVTMLEGGGKIGLEDLSSGEKQLTILLGEALLQQSAPSVYLADEPELSLHVVWQEQLMSCLRGLNPNAQLVIATHSPDIVGAYSDRVIEMDSVLG